MAAEEESPGTPAQAGPIAIYGASGFTGGLIARELHARGADIVLAGRSRVKLEPLSAELDGAPVAAVPLDDDPASASRSTASSSAPAPASRTGTR
jgi:short subunit dehydrogenase-like uncharacterized protein